jgi:hypothetical protein
MCSYNHTQKNWVLGMGMSEYVVTGTLFDLTIIPVTTNKYAQKNTYYFFKIM